MKLQHLTVIFILIILPITIVVSEYIDNQIERVNLIASYDRKLLNSTYDAIKAYKINTVTNAISDISNSKIEDIEAAINTFYNSLSTSFGYSGYKSKVMKQYVPAVVFAMYDGYYIYSPFQNVLTSVSKQVRQPGGTTYTEEGSINDSDINEDYQNDSTLNGLKPYIYYSVRYNLSDNNDFTITYTLDNYITIQGIIKGNYVYDYGYLITGITKNADGTYTYNEVTFSESDTEVLKEFLGNTEYQYVKINGTKYYLEGTGTGTNDYIFYIDSYGNKMTQCKSGDSNFEKYRKAIQENKSAYEYYKNAYKFHEKVMNNTYTEDDGTSAPGYNLKDITADKALYANESAGFSNYKIFEESDDVHLEYSTSNFNRHRSEVIRKVIETNLSTAITAYSNYSTVDTVFTMPKISETDWEMLENNICIATFLQGMKIGDKKYNGYSVVANTLTKEYVDENDIYILTTDKTYARANDDLFVSGGIQIDTSLGYTPGIIKVDFERKRYRNDAGEAVYYYPKCYINAGVQRAYLASYTSVVGSTTLNSLDSKQSLEEGYTDMYRYMKKKATPELKTVYYKALGRERWCSYNEANNRSDFSYFLDSY